MRATKLSLFLFLILTPIILFADAKGTKLPGQGTQTGKTFPTSGSNPTGAVNTSANGAIDKLKDKLKVPWGGFAPVVFPLCSDPTKVLIEFTPFFIGSVPSPVGTLLFDLTSLVKGLAGKFDFLGKIPGLGFLGGFVGGGGGAANVYAYFTAGLPFEWYLGFFKPIPGVAVIAVPFPPFCIPMPYLGTITDVGTGLP